MCPAPRKAENRGLERNLHTHPKGYRWKDPRTGKYHYFPKGTSRGDANATARALNLKYSPLLSVFDKIVKNESTTLRALVDLHIKEVLNKRDLSPKTLEIYRYCLGVISRKAGDMDVSSVTTRDLVLLIKELSKGERARQVYRKQLIELFTTAVSEGLCESNPATAIRREKVVRKRARLTIEGYRAIHAHAPYWVQNAMDLSLQTLQRREDIVDMKWTDDRGDALMVEIQKTGKRLAIEISGPVRDVLDRCHDDVASQYIIHRLPEKLPPRPKRAAGRKDHTQVMPEQLTRAFAKAVEASGFYAKQGPDQGPPTFHEVRSLGAALYREAGWPEPKIQSLFGHADVEMTRLYLEGHEAPWETVPAGLQTP